MNDNYEDVMMGLSPQEWLKINYNLQIGNRVVLTNRSTQIIMIKATDNIGHFRTKYPVVIGVENNDNANKAIDWITLESIIGY